MKIEISKEVQGALDKKVPILALESTIITHGMPFPENWETAQEVCQIVRQSGVVPALTAQINSKLKVGITDLEIKELAGRDDAKKVAYRDLPLALNYGRWGGTTVSATIYLAHLAGIPIMVTGGIGGVHRNFHLSLDISNDLVLLSRLKMLVISSGIKSILDIKASLELLETLGVSVVTYQSEQFPAFFSPNSGLKSPWVSNNPQEVAAILNNRWSALKMEGGILLANPLPASEAINFEMVEKAIAQALDKMSKLEQIEGKEVTPFLLAEVEKLTSGHSLKSNMALIKNNAKLGAEIASVYYQNYLI